MRRSKRHLKKIAIAHGGSPHVGVGVSIGGANPQSRAHGRLRAKLTAARNSAARVDVSAAPRKRISRRNQKSRGIENDRLLQIRIEPGSADPKFLPEEILIHAGIEGDSPLGPQPRISQGGEGPVKKRASETLENRRRSI